jgi:ferrous iron transport protein A
VPITPLSQLPRHTPARIVNVAWAAMAKSEQVRLKGLGVETGAEVELLHQGGWWHKDPLAVRLGRMTIAMRRALASHIQVEPI